MWCFCSGIQRDACGLACDYDVILAEVPIRNLSENNNFRGCLMQRGREDARHSARGI